MRKINSIWSDLGAQFCIVENEGQSIYICSRFEQAFKVCDALKQKIPSPTLLNRIKYIMTWDVRCDEMAVDLNEFDVLTENVLKPSKKSDINCKIGTNYV